MVTKAETGVMELQAKDYGSHQKLDKARKRSPQDEGAQPRRHFDF